VRAIAGGSVLAYLLLYNWDITYMPIDTMGRHAQGGGGGGGGGGGAWAGLPSRTRPLPHPHMPLLLAAPTHSAFSPSSHACDVLLPSTSFLRLQPPTSAALCEGRGDSTMRHTATSPTLYLPVQHSGSPSNHHGHARIPCLERWDCAMAIHKRDIYRRQTNSCDFP